MSLEFPDGTKIPITKGVKVGRDTLSYHIVALYEDGEMVETKTRDMFVSRIRQPGKDGTIHLNPIEGNRFILSVPPTSANGVGVKYEDDREDRVPPGNSIVLDKDASLIVGNVYKFSVGGKSRLKNSGLRKEQKSRLYEFDKNQLRKLRRLAVVGDLHGDDDALISLRRVADPTKDGIIFLGDYADRGSRGVEIIDTVNSLMKRYPQNVVALKGNHEDYTSSGNPTFSPCNLIYEAEKKKGNWQRYFQNELKPFIRSLSLGAIIPSEILFVHGGVSSRIKSLDGLRYPTREVEIDVLWSDPSEEDGEYPNRRGAGVEFGKDITKNVCKALGVKRVIRSHEPRKARDGPRYEHDGRVITTSSTSVYGGKPFVLIIDPNNPSLLSSHFL